jgi:hypothetical protein
VLGIRRRRRKDDSDLKAHTSRNRHPGTAIPPW